REFFKSIAGMFGMFLWLTGERLTTPVARAQFTVGTERRIVLIDDYAPQPPRWDSFWPDNRLGGARDKILTKSGRAEFRWQKSSVDASILDGTGISVGESTTLNHLRREQLPQNFSRIF